MSSLPQPMAAKRRDTVQRRTVLVAVGAALISAVVALAVSIPMISIAARNQAQQELANLAEVTAASLESPRPGSVARLADLLASQNTQAYLVFEESRPPEGLSADLLSPVFVGEAVSTTTEIGGTEMFVEARPVGRAGVVLLSPAEPAGNLVTVGLRRLTLALLAGLAVAGIVGVLAARRVTAPLRRVAEGAEQLVAGHRDVRVATDGPQEVAEIADAINRLSAALQQSEGRQREFLLTVSHELRTPLTAVAGFAEALSDGVVSNDDVARTGGLMLDESRRLNRLVSDLLDLSRLGAAGVEIERTEVELRALVSSAALVWRDRCDREGLDLVLELPVATLRVTTDADRVRQIIDNLVGNALRVTPAGGVIVLALSAEGPDAVLQVRDSGPGLTAEDMALAFEPGVLYERYRGVRPVGSGVGLALVGRLASRLGGSAQVGTASEGGASFTVRLPAAGGDVAS